MLTYPGFSVVFIQTFSVHHTKEFILPEEALAQMNKEYRDFDEERGVSVEKADALKVPIAWVERDIENQIFVLPDKSPLEAPASAKKWNGTWTKSFPTSQSLSTKAACLFTIPKANGAARCSAL